MHFTEEGLDWRRPASGGRSLSPCYRPTVGDVRRHAPIGRASLGMLNQNACARCISLNMVNEGFLVIGDFGQPLIFKKGRGVSSMGGG